MLGTSSATTITEVLGFSGALIAAYAYAPQISHLARERCSAGISIRAFGLWLAASLLIAVHAFAIVDPIFILLGLIQFGATAVILFFGHKYECSVCDFHRAHPEAARVTHVAATPSSRRSTRKMGT